MPKFTKPMVATMLAGMCTFLNIYCIQPLLPLLRQVFHASELQVSFTVSATILATALTAPFIGMIAERLGRKKVIVPSLFLLTVPTFLAATSLLVSAGARLTARVRKPKRPAIALRCACARFAKSSPPG